MEKSKLVNALKDTGKFMATITGLTLFMYLGIKSLQEMGDYYFAQPSPKIIYYGDGQPILTKTFETNEEMQAYLDTSQVHKAQMALLGHTNYSDSTEDTISTNK